MTEFLGYTVEKVEETPDELGIAYVLYGPRGSRYTLLRNVPNPQMLFACNDRKFGVVTLKGHSWFTDKNGYLEVAR